MEILAEVGLRVRQLRQKLNLTQDELAQKAGYTSRSSINKIEKGLVDIPQSKISDLADALGTTPAYLMGWNESPAYLTECSDDENPYELELRKAFSKYDIDAQRIIAKNLSELSRTQISVTDKEKPAIEDELSEDVIIYHRDGKTVKKQFTKEQMDLLLTMINAIPEKPKDI